MNIDVLNPSGVPIENPRLPYYRFAANVSQSNPAMPHGNQDLAHFYTRYDPVIDKLRSWNADICLVFTHQTFGEGAGFNWTQMTTADWQRWIAGMVDKTVQIAMHYKRQIKWYQIGNEHDQASEAAIYIPPAVYGDLFRRMAAAIRASDTAAKVITAGMVSGAQSGVNYLRIANVVAFADGVSFHAYGQDIAVNPDFGQFGRIEEFIQVARTLGKPVHITEWGALDHEGRMSVEAVAAYARRMLVAMQGKIETAHYFAWGRMHNAYAVSPALGQIRQPLLTELKKVPQSGGGGGVTPIGAYRLTSIPGVLRFRTQPSLTGAVITLLKNGDYITPLDEPSVHADGYRWRKISAGGDVGFIAVEGGGLSVGVKL